MLKKSTMLKKTLIFLSISAILSAIITQPLFAQTANSEQITDSQQTAFSIPKTAFAEKLTTFAEKLTAFSIPKTAFAEYQEYQEYWEIDNFHADITINKNGTVNITETITADFANEPHRGLARIIPYKYKLNQNKSYNAKLKFISATNENNISWNNKVYKEKNDLVIEMRTQDWSQLSTKAVYKINYMAERVINRFHEDPDYPHDELYWNVNGTEWVVPIKQISATIILPENLTQEEIKLECFTGKYGETNKDCSWNMEGNKINFFGTKEFDRYENLSIVIGMPPGTVEIPTTAQKVLCFIEDYWKIFLPMLVPTMVFIFMFTFWYMRGRDAKVARDIIMPHYHPPKKLSATESGTIIDEKLNPNDITATIIDFAIKGFIKITELNKGKDFELKLIKPYTTEHDFEKIILEGIFTENKEGQTTKLSALNNKFYKEVPKITKSVMEQLVKDNYFPHNPNTIRAIYTTIGSVLIFGPLFLGIAAFSIGLFFALIISGIIIIIFGQFMPRKTVKGTETYFHLKGLYEYIKTAEKDRIEFQEQANIFFEKLLPYAMAFGLAKKWAKTFENLIKTPPNWYKTSAPNAFSMGYFADRLSSLNAKATQNFMSRPGGSSGGSSGSWGGSSGFSGGGFSGGGFGGGGGRGL